MHSESKEEAVWEEESEESAKLVATGNQVIHEEKLHDTTADIASQTKQSQKASGHAGGNGRSTWAFLRC